MPLHSSNCVCTSVGFSLISVATPARKRGFTIARGRISSESGEGCVWGGAGLQTFTITPGLTSDLSVFISFCDMFDFELDFESDGDCTRDDWRVEVGVLLSVPPLRALSSVFDKGRAGVSPRIAAAEAVALILFFVLC
eukprot:CAMPEP_0179491264 /NCGR_PEP_ID=MMETSP0799-20121207/65980_1 /TAXON_ID=46947 /ORGANISM="Geminigera cryophila, Strain CCMP2564" /LENGTH=137 /DNA_ID=CAMNT_0021307673 /DNA_START=38 /DNA_END=448 /DNA_ORIENTATION=-